MLRRERQRPSAPVFGGDFPDPFVLVSGGRYFVYGTQTGDLNVQVMESGDLARWEHRGEALPELPHWADRGRTWSPAVLSRDGGLLLYYAVRHAGAGRQCISVATGSDPAGPFVDRSEGPLIFLGGIAGLRRDAGLQGRRQPVRPPSSVRHTVENIVCVTQPWVASVKEMASRAGRVKSCLSHVAPPSRVLHRPLPPLAAPPRMI